MNLTKKKPTLPPKTASSLLNLRLRLKKSLQPATPLKSRVTSSLSVNAHTPNENTMPKECVPPATVRTEETSSPGIANTLKD